MPDAPAFRSRAVVSRAPRACYFSGALVAGASITRRQVKVNESTEENCISHYWSRGIHYTLIITVLRHILVRQK